MRVARNEEAVALDGKTVTPTLVRPFEIVREAHRTVTSLRAKHKRLLVRVGDGEAPTRCVRAQGG